jgi:hypothetical protein
LLAGAVFHPYLEPPTRGALGFSPHQLFQFQRATAIERLLVDEYVLFPMFCRVYELSRLLDASRACRIFERLPVAV